MLTFDETLAIINERIQAKIVARLDSVRCMQDRIESRRSTYHVDENPPPYDSPARDLLNTISRIANLDREIEVLRGIVDSLCAAASRKAQAQAAQ